MDLAFPDLATRIMKVRKMTLVNLAINNLALPRPKRISFLAGKNLSKLTKSISRDGLLNPLTVRKTGNKKFLVVDGRKRLFAIRNLSRNKKLPRTLYNVPCVLNDKESTVLTIPDRPALMPDSQLIQYIIQAHNEGWETDQLAERFFCTYDVVAQVLSLRTLHPKIMEYLNRDLLTLEQAAAFAKIRNQTAQWKLLMHLGPFVHEKHILAAMNQGDTVVELPGGEILVLPSRRDTLREQNADEQTATVPSTLLAA